jgi:hypothetical protein
MVSSNKETEAIKEFRYALDKETSERFSDEVSGTLLEWPVSEKRLRPN